MRVWSAQGAKVPRHVAEEQAGEGEDGGDEGAGPASAEVGELGDGLGKEDLVGVALEVAQDGGAEDGGDDDDAEEREADVVVGVGVRPIEQDLAVAVADRAEAFDGDVEERKREPERKVDVGGEALEAELELEGEEFPEQCHVGSSKCEGLVRNLAAWPDAKG